MQKILSGLLWVMLGVVFIGGLIVSGISIYKTSASSDLDLELDVLNGGWYAVALFAYDTVTPSIHYEWTGNPDSQIFWIEQFPMPNSKDIIVLWFWGSIVYLGIKVILENVKQELDHQVLWDSVRCHIRHYLGLGFVEDFFVCSFILHCNTGRNSVVNY